MTETVGVLLPLQLETKFVPPADLTNPELHKVRTDGNWQSYLSAGGAVMLV